MSREEILEELRGMSRTLHAIAKNFERGDSSDTTADALAYAIGELQEIENELKK